MARLPLTLALVAFGLASCSQKPEPEVAPGPAAAPEQTAAQAEANAVAETAAATAPGDEANDADAKTATATTATPGQETEAADPALDNGPHCAPIEAALVVSPSRHEPFLALDVDVGVIDGEGYRPRLHAPYNARVTHIVTTLVDLSDDDVEALQLRCLRGRRVTLYDGAGRSCSATLDQFVLLGQVRPFYDTLVDWGAIEPEPSVFGPPPEAYEDYPEPDIGEGYGDAYGSGEGEDVDSEEELARMAWRESHIVAAAPLKLSRGCGDLVWGRQAELAAPRIYPVVAAPPALAEAALQQFAELPRYDEIASSFLPVMEERRQAGRWESMNGAPTITLIGDGDAGWVSVSARPGDQCMGAIHAWALWPAKGMKVDARPTVVDFDDNDETGAIDGLSILAAFTTGGPEQARVIYGIDHDRMILRLVDWREDPGEGFEGIGHIVPSSGTFWVGECGD